MRDLVSLPVPQSLGESDAPQVEGIVEWAAATGTPTTVEWAVREISTQLRTQNTKAQLRTQDLKTDQACCGKPITRLLAIHEGYHINAILYL